eukprot:gene12712-8674_t
MFFDILFSFLYNFDPKNTKFTLQMQRVCRIYRKNIFLTLLFNNIYININTHQLEARVHGITYYGSVLKHVVFILEILKAEN